MSGRQKEKTPARKSGERSTNQPSIDIQTVGNEAIYTLEDNSVETLDFIDAEYAVNSEESLETRIEVRNILRDGQSSPSDEDGNIIAVSSNSRDPLRLEERTQNLNIIGE